MPPQNSGANRKKIVDFLTRFGVRDGVKVDQIVGGFDLNKPVYEQLVEPGDRIFQFLRNPEIGRPSITTGNWFCVSGATMKSLAIMSGGAGRHLVEFTVSRTVIGMEGTASPKQRDWTWAGGGPGGATQLYLPQIALMALEGKGTHLDAT